MRAYILVAPRGDGPEEPEALRWVCAGLERLLQHRLAIDGWDGRLDGIWPATDMLPDAIQVISPVELSLRGRAWWIGPGPSVGLEPFFGSIRISETKDAIVSYQFGFGDKEKGLGTGGKGHSRWPDWYFPREWYFTFSKGLK